MRPIAIALVLSLGLILPACEAPPGRRSTAVPIGHEGPFTTWWTDKQFKERGTYLAGQRNGQIDVFYKSGTLHYTGMFVLGQPDGLITTYHPDGQLASTENFDRGRLHGERSRYSATKGELVERIEYQNGIKHGVEEQWGETGRLTLQGEWTSGLPSGVWKHWDPIGRLVREERYWLVGGIPTGYLESVFTSGGIASVQTIRTRTRSGNRDIWAGWVTTWHDNGQQASLVEYEDGLMHGRDASWDRTGRLVSEGRRENDKRTGSWTFFGSRGEGARTVLYLDGEIVPVEAETAEVVVPEDP